MVGDSENVATICVHILSNRSTKARAAVTFAAVRTSPFCRLVTADSAADSASSREWSRDDSTYTLYRSRRTYVRQNRESSPNHPKPPSHPSFSRTSNAHVSTSWRARACAPNVLRRMLPKQPCHGMSSARSQQRRTSVQQTAPPGQRTLEQSLDTRIRRQHARSRRIPAFPSSASVPNCRGLAENRERAIDRLFEVISRGDYGVLGRRRDE